MTRRGDQILRAIRRADPGADPSVTSWAAGDEAREIADRIRAEGDESGAPGRPPRSRRSRLVILAAAVLIAALTVAAAITLRSGTPKLPSLVGCYQELRADSGAVFVSAIGGVDPVEACRRSWLEAFGVSAPARLVACVRPEGGSVVYPQPEEVSASDTCSSVGTALSSNSEGG